jgi:aminomethyltransferase
VVTAAGDLASYFASRGIATQAFAAGVTTPRRFTDPRSEHLATRRHAGLFDFSFMGCWEITGRDSLAFLQSLQTRNLRMLGAGRLVYTLLCRPDGTVLNDATVWCHHRHAYWLFTGRRADGGHVARHALPFSVEVREISSVNGVLAVQGPRSAAILSRLLDLPQLGTLAYFQFTAAQVLGGPAWIARIGYSGESGFELVVPAAAGAVLWERLRRDGAPYGMAECGFGAADSLRIEAGHMLFSQELREDATPFELGLGRLVEPRTEPFIGSDRLRRLRRQGVRKRLSGLVFTSDGLVRQAKPYPTAAAARLTSDCDSPTFGRQLGLGWLDAPDSCLGRIAYVQDGRRARVARLPFFDPPRIVARLPLQLTG